MPDLFDTYLPWFTLREIPLIGNATIKKLIHEFGSPENIFTAPKKELSCIRRISDKIIHNIGQHKKFEATAEKELERVLKKGYHIVCLKDKAYPELLSRIPDPPPVITFKGNIDHTAPCIAIVGSRTATSYGLSTAKNLAYRLGKKGFQVVSGLARGIDAMAHEGALAAGEKTIAVLGSGLARIYPKENTRLFHAIADNGCLMSEFKINADPAPANFPIRNRIIAGLSCGCIVVEAARKSGSLITARLANEYNREVFAVPGSIKSKKSEGTHHLLKQGARLVETEMDIIDELYQFVHPEKIRPDHSEHAVTDPHAAPPKKTAHSGTLLNFIGPYPVHFNDLVDKSRLKSATVSSLLLDLELQGMVKRHQGNFYSISEENHWQNH